MDRKTILYAIAVLALALCLGALVEGLWGISVAAAVVTLGAAGPLFSTQGGGRMKRSQPPAP